MTSSSAKTTAILVHGAFADGSAWNNVTPLLQEAGLDVIAVQNPLDSLEGDVATTQRAIDKVDGPVVLVGHSWGGVVITQAGADPQVKSLVYVAAFAPDVGQSVRDMVEGTQPPPGVKSFTPDTHGYISLPRDAVVNYLAPDLDESVANLIFTNQTPINGKALGTPVSAAAWQNKPSFYAVSLNDLMTPTSLQEAMAAKISATTLSLPSSHVSQLSHPRAIANLIITAAE